MQRLPSSWPALLPALVALLVACAADRSAPASLGTARTHTAPAVPALPRSLRVACLGDSITAGARLEDPDHHAWPAQLAWRLPIDVEVRAFAAGGRTLLRDTDLPFTDSAAWERALAWRPDVALVLLGTNDTCGPPRDCWGHADDLADDAEALVRDLRAAAPACQVLLVRPADLFPDRDGLSAERREDLATRAPRLATLDQALARVAAAHDGVSHLSAAGVLQPRHCADGVHPDPFGHEALADWSAARLRAPDGPLERAARRLAGQAPSPPRWAPWPDVPALRAVPSAEHRGHPAGWSGRSWWQELERLVAAAEQDPAVPLVFLGDSITQGLTGAADRRARADGTRAIDRWHGRRGALSLGLSGDRTEHLLWRIRHGALTRCDPRLIVLNVGVNNVNAAGHPGADTAAGVLAVVDALAVHEPQARILVCGPFPCGRPGEARREAIDAVHQGLAVLADRPGVTYRDLRALFLDADGRTNERMAGDTIHLTASGYEAWLEAIEADVARLLGE